MSNEDVKHFDQNVEMPISMINNIKKGVKNTVASIKNTIDNKTQLTLEKAIFQLRYNQIYSSKRRAKPLYKKLEPFCKTAFNDDKEIIRSNIND
jgi:hypothetical protein